MSSEELNQFTEQGSQNAQVISTISMDVWKVSFCHKLKKSLHFNLNSLKTVLEKK